jgi:thioredoxin
VIFIFLEGAAPPALEQSLKGLARDQAGQLLVVQVPVKDSPEAVRRYQVGHFPAVVTVREGKKLSQAEGVSGQDVEKHAAYLLGKGPRPQAAANGRSGASQGPAAGGEGKPRAVTDATFEQEVMRSPQPVLVDFWAPWCGPCRMVEPVLEKLAREMAGRVRIAKVNVDENPRIAGQYGVQSIPTMMVVRDGQVLDRWAGALPEMALRNRIAPWLGN